MKESTERSIYPSIVAMGFRARQINDDIKAELNERMADVLQTTDENDGTNFDQISISREFDKYPKPTFLSMKEMFTGKLTYEFPKLEEDEEDFE